MRAAVAMCVSLRQVVAVAPCSPAPTSLFAPALIVAALAAWFCPPEPRNAVLFKEELRLKDWKSRAKAFSVGLVAWIAFSCFSDSVHLSRRLKLALLPTSDHRHPDLI